MSSVIAFLKRQYQQRPFVSNVLTMSALYGAGDCIQVLVFMSFHSTLLVLTLSAILLSKE
jgi:hypothetical protein